MSDLIEGNKNPGLRDDASKFGHISVPVGQSFLDLPVREYGKTQTIYAIRMDEEFDVSTIEGDHHGKAGDWLAVGAAGELYPIDAAVFAATYEEVGR
jgi:hypothetical protein